MDTVRARESALLTEGARPGTHVARPRVVRLLTRALDAPLTLIDAPMGYGKTAAVRDLLASATLSRPAAFVELAPAGEAGPLWDRVLRSMASAWPDLRLDAALADADPPAGAGVDVRTRVLPLLHERTAGVDGPRVVVLDALDRRRDPEALADLAYLVDRLPPALRLVATTRRLPALPIGRWRAQGSVAEITMDDLRLRDDEVAALLGGDVADRSVRELTDRSEGWVAGLRLLAGLPDPRAPLDAAAAEQLLDAVLVDQPVEAEDFLLDTALLGRFTADLCREVTGRSDAGMLLHDLQAANLFVVPLDDQGDWFRYQRLFAELLRGRRERRTTSARHVERRRSLHRTAAAWFASDAKAADAVAHHVRAGDVDRAVTLLNGDVDVFARGPQVQGIDWEGLFPSAWLEEDAQRMIWFAALLAPTGGMDRMGVWLDRAEAALAGSDADARGDERGLRGLLAAVQTYWHALRYDAAGTLERGEEALALLDDAVTAEVMGRRVLISMLAAYVLADDLEGAERVCARLDSPGGHEIVRNLVVPGYRARLALRRGQLAQAEGLARLVRRAAGAMGFPLHLGVRDANLALGGVLAERGEVAEAAALFDEAVAMAEERGWLPSAVVTGVERVRLAAGVDGPAAGLAGVERLRGKVAGHAVGPDAIAPIDALEATLLLAGPSPEALGRASGLISGLRRGVRRRLLEVRLALASGDAALAGSLLGHVGPANLRDRLVADLLTARIAAAGGDHVARDRHLVAAADRARSQGFRRIFLDEAPELVPALRALADSRTELRPLVDEVETLAAASAHGRAEPLTDRELSVLRLLQSRLTHHEIAGELGISANTLKTHTRSLYRKLGATSRSAAISTALRSGLL